MANAYKDGNGVSTWLGVSCVDGTTLVRIAIDSATGGLKTDSTTVISFTPNARHATLVDENSVPVKTGISSTDSSVILPLYVNPTNGAVLIET